MDLEIHWPQGIKFQLRGNSKIVFCSMVTIINDNDCTLKTDHENFNCSYLKQEMHMPMKLNSGIRQYVQFSEDYLITNSY